MIVGFPESYLLKNTFFISVWIFFIWFIIAIIHKIFLFFDLLKHCLKTLKKMKWVI